MQPIKMQRRTISKDWLSNKYGEQVQLWEAQLQFDNKNGNATGQFAEDGHDQVFYSYVKTN